jgi:hypothetical protein
VLVQVDMSKVKIDVIKPWIATRVTELLGFEDEVLINFIYGLLDVKVMIAPVSYISSSPQNYVRPELNVPHFIFLAGS